MHPHSRRTLRTAAELAACRELGLASPRATARDRGSSIELYPQNVRDTLRETLDYLQHERSTAAHDLRRDAERAASGVFTDDVQTYLARRASDSDYRGRDAQSGSCGRRGSRRSSEHRSRHRRSRQRSSNSPRGVETGHDHAQEEWTPSTALVIGDVADTGAAPVESVCRPVSGSAESGARTEGPTAAEVARGREGATDACRDGLSGGDAQSAAGRATKTSVVCSVRAAFLGFAGSRSKSSGRSEMPAPLICGGATPYSRRSAWSSANTVNGHGVVRVEVEQREARTV